MSKGSEDNRIIVRFENTKPVSLRELSSALGSLSRQYSSFITNETGGLEIDADLRVREVREGSILLELVSSIVLPVIPLLWKGDDSLSEWMKYLRLAIRSLKEGKAPSGRSITTEDYRDYKNIFTPVSKDQGSNLFIEQFNNHGTINVINISSSEATEMRKVVEQQERLDVYVAVPRFQPIEKKAIDAVPKFQTIEKKAMKWDQAKFDPQSETGNRAVIEDLSAKPLKVIFQDREVRESMQHQTSEDKTPWHELVYIVDVEVELKNGEPKSYKILKYYAEVGM